MLRAREELPAGLQLSSPCQQVLQPERGGRDCDIRVGTDAPRLLLSASPPRAGSASRSAGKHLVPKGTGHFLPTARREEMLWLTGCQHCTQPRCGARGSCRLPSPSPSAGGGREAGPEGAGAGRSRCAVTWGLPGLAATALARPGSVQPLEHAAVLGALLRYGRWRCWRGSCRQSGGGQAGSRRERHPRALPQHGCPGQQRAQQPGSASRLSGAAPSGKGTDWRVRIGFLFPVLDFVTSGRDDQKRSSPLPEGQGLFLL